MKSPAQTVLLVAVLLLAACGGSSGGPAGTATHDTPDGAVRGLVNALAAGDSDRVADWIAPDQRADFTSAIDDARSLDLTVSFHVKGFSIGAVTTSGDGATVRYQGDVTACISRPGGNSSTDGAGCHPVQSQSGGSKADTFVCVRRNGAWYVSLSNTSPGG